MAALDTGAIEEAGALLLEDINALLEEIAALLVEEIATLVEEMVMLLDDFGVLLELGVAAPPQPLAKATISDTSKIFLVMAMP